MITLTEMLDAIESCNAVFEEHRDELDVAVIFAKDRIMLSVISKCGWRSTFETSREHFETLTTKTFIKEIMVFASTFKKAIEHGHSDSAVKH